MYVTHLTWRPDDSARRQVQLHEVLEFIRRTHRAALPPVLLGDLNAEPNSDEIRMLTGRKAAPTRSPVFVDLWEQAGDGTPGHTWDRANPYNADEPWPVRRLDYILAGLPTEKPVTGWFVPLRAWRAGMTPQGDVHPSDHYAVVAELRLMTSKTEEAQQIEKFGVDHVAGPPVHARV